MNKLKFPSNYNKEFSTESNSSELRRHFKFSTLVAWPPDWYVDKSERIGEWKNILVMGGDVID